MNEPDIAPLARRLAEENNVDWRRLEGSGDGGRIVERDVLTFLAKVMAGEEELDPTPEPVPEGMQAWPDADVAAYRAAAAAPPVERSVTSTLDDDLFLFDEAPGAGAAPAAPRDDVPPVFDEPVAAAPADAPASVDEDDDGLLLVDEPEDDGALAASVHAADDDGDDDVFAFDEPVADADARRGSATDLPELFEVDPSPAAEADDALFVDDDGPSQDAEADRGVFIDLDDRRSDAGSSRAGGDAVARRRADDFAATEERIDDGLGYVIGDAPEGAAAVADAPATALDAADVVLVRHGQLWRRRLDDRAFRSAVSQIADALGAAPSAVAVVLLARAVRRAWPAEGAIDGWWWTVDEARRRPVASDGAFRDALAALEADEDASGGPTAVVVADLSSIALDEAVLHLDAPVLALGRATGDGAWLTLSGDDVPQGAVAALGRVAEALAAPVRLLV